MINAEHEVEREQIQELTHMGKTTVGNAAGSLGLIDHTM
jgi:hypothetical protein